MKLSTSILWLPLDVATVNRQIRLDVATPLKRSNAGSTRRSHNTENERNRKNNNNAQLTYNNCKSINH